MSKKIITIIDDDAFIRQLYTADLEADGYFVITAVDGLDGLKKVKDKRPDLIILDIMMPKRNGMEVLAELKAGAETKDIPVIMHSSLQQTEDILKAKNLGASDYLVKKDTDYHTLKTTITKILGNKKE